MFLHLQNNLRLAFNLILNLAFDSIQGCSHGPTGGGAEENGPPRREKAELGVRLPAPCWPGGPSAHHRAPPRPLLPSSAPAHVQCSHQRRFQTGRCLFIRYLLLLILLELPHLWLQKQCWPLPWERLGGRQSEPGGRGEGLSAEWSDVIPASDRRPRRARAVLSRWGCGNGLELLKGLFPKEMVLIWGRVGDQKTAGALYSLCWDCVHLL